MAIARSASKVFGATVGAADVGRVGGADDVGVGVGCGASAAGSSEHPVVE